LTSLPSEIGNLDSLRALDVQSNNLTSMPPETGNLSSLERLGLRQNDLISLPAEIGDLASLKYLYISESHLTTLPQSIVKLTPKVSVYGNHLTNVTSKVATWLDQYAEPNWRECQTPAPQMASP
jgi:leucine-rich repeat protein SHOC2